jgi:NarL family two-component system response regulator LiaR
MDPDFVLHGEAANGAELLAKLEESGTDLPHVILMDMMMPVMDGIEATREVTRRYPDIKVIVLTSFLEDDKVVEAVEAGAASYILKTVNGVELANAIRTVMGGAPAMTPEVAQALTRGLRRRTAREDDDDLTAREKEVLLLIAEGKSNKEISEELHISIKTVKTHVSNLLMKCNLEDRTQLAIYAHRKGWV